MRSSRPSFIQSSNAVMVALMTMLFMAIFASSVFADAEPPFQIRQFSHDLVPAGALNLSSGELGGFQTLRGSYDFYSWLNSAPAGVEMGVIAGRYYQNRGPARFDLFPTEDPMSNSAAHVEVPPDQQSHQISLNSTFDGLQRIAVSDGEAGTRLSWDEGTPMTLGTSENFPTTVGRWTMYFYVPIGTETVGGYASASKGSIEAADGSTALTFTSENKNSYWSVPVPSGQDGKLWKLSKILGGVQLMTVPPQVARSADELLLPSEVVEEDAQEWSGS